MKNILLFILLTFVLVVCNSNSKANYKDIKTYGESKFISDVLAFKKDLKLDPKIKRAFKPQKAENYLNGVLLIFEETQSYKSGIYVDENSLEGWGGSGLEITNWSKQIAWVTIKKRN